MKATLITKTEAIRNAKSRVGKIYRDGCGYSFQTYSANGDPIRPIYHGSYHDAVVNRSARMVEHAVLAITHCGQTADNAHSWFVMNAAEDGWRWQDVVARTVETMRAWVDYVKATYEYSCSWGSVTASNARQIAREEGAPWFMMQDGYAFHWAIAIAQTEWDAEAAAVKAEINRR